MTDETKQLPVVIALPAEVTKPVEISAAWLEKRNNLVGRMEGALAGEQDIAWYDSASRVMQEAAKVLSAFEKARVGLCRPFNEAAKEIKREADKAREPLDTRQRGLKGALSNFAIAKQRAKREEERKRAAAEADRLEKIRLAEQEAAAKRAELTWDDEPVEEPPPPPKAYPPPAPPVVITPPESTHSQVVETLGFEIAAPENVPANLCTPDPVKIRTFIQGRRDTLMALLNEGGPMVDDPESRSSEKLVPGIRVFVKTDVRSGR